MKEGKEKPKSLEPERMKRIGIGKKKRWEIAENENKGSAAS
jgi:hypothetical protein